MDDPAAGGSAETDREQEWRGSLLNTALRASTVAAVVFTTTFALFHGPGRRYGVSVGIPLSAVLALTAWRTAWPFRLRAGTLTAMLYAATAATLATMGYGPAPILVGTWCVVAAGLLFGPRALYAVGALLVATILAIGALQPYYSLLLTTAQDFAPPRMMPWVRIAIVYTVSVGVMGLALRSAVSSLARVLADRTSAIRLAADALETEQRAHEGRRTAEQALQESQKLEAVGHLAAGLVHALNNGLTVIQLSVGELRRARPGTAAAAAAARELSIAWRPAAEVAGQLLGLSRREPTTSEIVDASELVRDVEAALRTALPEDARLVADADGPAPVQADAKRLRQAVINLVLHARDALVLGRDIRLRVGVERDVAPRGVLDDVLPRGHYATITVVSDDAYAGPDSTTQIATAFEPHNLRLFTTLAIVRNGGGTIAATTSPARETTLRIYWPLAQTLTPRPTGNADTTASPPRVAGSSASPVVVPTRSDAVVNGTSDALDVWRQATLHRTTSLLLPIYATAAAVFAAISATYFARVGPVLAGCAGLLALARYGTFLSPRGRGACTAAGVLGATVIITASGGFAPAAFALSATGVMLVAALWGGWPLAASLAFSVLAIIAGGVVVSVGWITPLTMAFDPTSLAVWVRVAGMMLLVLVLVTTVVVRTLDSLRQACEQRQGALAALEEQRATARAARAAQLDTEHALAAADRADTLGRLAGSVAHDVNNALTVIGAWGPLLERAGDEATFRAGLDAIDEALAQAVAVTRQLAFNGAQLPFRSQPCDLRDAVQRTAHTLGSVLPSTIAVHVEAPHSAAVLVDPTAVRQVLFNLALNSRDAMPRGGTLTLRVAADIDVAATRATLEVTDNGEGMSEVVAQQAFEPFFTTKSADSGTGLGLASVKRIVATTGGKLELITEPGVGTTIRIAWPLLGSARMTSHVAPPRAHQSLSAAHILLAEDEALVRDGMATALRRAGCQVMTANDGNEAARVLEDPAVRIDVLCVDGIMPGVPTTQLIQRCQQRRPGAAILICSGHMSEELSRRALTDDGVDFLLKPFSSDELLARVANVLEHSKRPRVSS